MGIAVGPDGQIATASFDNAVGLWTDERPEWLDGHEAAVTTVHFNHTALLSAGDDFVGQVRAISRKPPILILTGINTSPPIDEIASLGDELVQSGLATPAAYSHLRLHPLPP